MLVTVVKSLGFLRVKSGFTFRVCQGGLRFDRVQGFLGYRGFLRQGYCLGLVTVVQGLGLLKVQSGFVLRVIQGFLRLSMVAQVFQCLEVFCGLGIALGLVTVVQGLGIGLRFRVVSRFGLFRVVYGWVGFRVLRVQSGFAFRVAYGWQGLGFFRVQSGFVFKLYSYPPSLDKSEL